MRPVAKENRLWSEWAMFLSQLTPPQQESFLQLAAHLVAVDGVITPEEQNMLAQLAVGAEDWVPQTALPVASLVLAFDSSRSRAAALLELIGLAYADTVYAEEERAFIDDLARRMEISPARVSLMESWVIRQLALAEEGHALLEGC